MKKIVLIFITAASFENIYAQETPPKFDEIFVTPEKKNELGINTTPLFKVLIGSTDSEANRFALTYKRALNSKSALRISTVVDMVNMNNANQFAFRDTIFQDGSSAMMKQKDIYSNYIQPHLNIGYERRFGKNRTQFFYGSDLILGYYQKNYSRQYVQLISDTTNGVFHWVDNGGTQRTILSRKSSIFFTGMDAFFGAKYSLSKRFAVSAQIGFDMTYSKETAVEKDESGTQRTYHFTSFDFSGKAGIINDVSLVYKF